MPIMVSKVADIINGWIVFSRFAKKTVPGEMRINVNGVRKPRRKPLMSSDILVEIPS
jgi:hypothetical protein